MDQSGCLNKRDIWLIVTHERNDDDKAKRQRRESHPRHSPGDAQALFSRRQNSHEHPRHHRNSQSCLGYSHHSNVPVSASMLYKRPSIVLTKLSKVLVAKMSCRPIMGLGCLTTPMAIISLLQGVRDPLTTYNLFLVFGRQGPEVRIFSPRPNTQGSQLVTASRPSGACL